MSQRRKRERDIIIDYSRVNWKRRRRCRPRPDLFCRAYFPEIFFNPFTKDQKEIIDALKSRILYGGCQAIAAERGGGKTSITRIVGGVWAVVYGHADYIVLLNANGVEAGSTLEDIKQAYEKNDRLRDDFPEICDPVRALEGSAQRGRSQTVDGVRTLLKWSTREVHFPIVAGSAASGAVVTCRGADAAIRGLVKGEKRPKLVVGDDVETRATAESIVETNRRKKILERDVVGLAGPGSSMAILLLCTTINRKCLAWQYTDRKKNPQWNGIRQRWIKKKPKNEDLWTRYTEMRRDNFIDGDLTARGAHKFYKKNRRKMDAGSLVSNRRRFIHKKLDDGSYLEISSLQSAYNIIADGGWDNFAAEYQNDPPVEDQIETIGLTNRIVMSRTGGIPRGTVPAWCEYLTAGLDIGRRTINWTVVAWQTGMRGHVVDYGTDPVYSPDGSHKDEIVQQQIADAVLVSLMKWRDWETETGWKSESAPDNRHADIVTVDSGYMESAVYDFTRANVNKKYKATKGFGTLQKTRYKTGREPKAGRRHGHHYFVQGLKEERVYLYHVDADYWKQIVQNGFLIEPGKLGSLTLFGDDKIRHAEYSKQICAEQWVREFKTGTGFVEGYRQHYRHNHYLDSTAGAAVAAAIAGCKVLIVTVQDKPKEKLSLRKLQEHRRQGR